jgi:hypothetical protein
LAYLISKTGTSQPTYAQSTLVPCHHYLFTGCWENGWHNVYFIMPPVSKIFTALTTLLSSKS